MQRLTSLVRLIIVAAVLGSCVSCAVGVSWMAIETGAPRDVNKPKKIEPGVTDLSDILEWFGPPDLIIDGTKEIFDRQGMLNPGLRLPTRTLSAPEGEVIFLYTMNLRAEVRSVEVAHPIATVQKKRFGVRVNELMIFVRKRDHKIVNAFTGEAGDERS